LIRLWNSRSRTIHAPPIYNPGGCRAWAFPDGPGEGVIADDQSSVKEIAHEIGYTRQHDLTLAFRKHTGASPSEWKTHANGFSHQKDWVVSVRSRPTAESVRTAVPFSARFSGNAKYFS
jgi:hypothetical protein